MRTDPARISIRVQPGSNREEMVLRDGVIRVRLKAPANEGKANKQLVSYLAKALDVPQSAVSIQHGLTSRTKLVSIAAVDQAEIDRRLASLINGGEVPAR